MLTRFFICRLVRNGQYICLETHGDYYCIPVQLNDYGFLVADEPYSSDPYLDYPFTDCIPVELRYSSRSSAPVVVPVPEIVFDRYSKDFFSTASSPYDFAEIIKEV